jgi:hypothetical protein
MEEAYQHWLGAKSALERKVSFLKSRFNFESGSIRVAVPWLAKCGSD